MSGARDVALIKAFASVLRERRVAAGMTQEELADRAGVDRTYIGLLERRLRQPSLSAIVSIATALALAPDALLKRVCVAAEIGS